VLGFEQLLVYLTNKFGFTKRLLFSSCGVIPVIRQASAAVGNPALVCNK